MTAVRWGAITACWLVWGLFYASRLRLVISDVSWAETLSYSMPDAVLWAALTPIPLALARRFPIRADRWWAHIPLHLAAAGVVAGVHGLLDATLNVVFGSPLSFGEMLLHLLRFGVHTNVMLYFAIVGVSQFFARSQRLRERERQASELRAQLAQARLDALQMQLRPHFLFNALNTVSGLVEQDVAAGRRVLRQLGDVLRMILQRRDRQEVSVREELDLVRAYLAIESARFGERLTVQVDVAEKTLGLAVPSFLLQPLVENAVTHAVARRIRGGRIDLRAWCGDGSRLVVSVEDNGAEDASAPVESGQGIGLTNARARLRQLYGDEQELRVLRNERGGWTVTVSIPARSLADAMRRSA
ncbi:MAG TPA: histidine kinase [Candidatus Polarisedimenticolaceae bacterium]|nr:histidine kinase [Candidatus Polarisedimenticolaceae bacterium]